MRRRAMAASGLASVALVAGGLAWTTRGEGSGSGGSDGDDAAAPQATAEVTKKDLEERAEVDGTIGYGDAVELSLSGSSSPSDDGSDPTNPNGDDGNNGDTGDNGDSGSGTITHLPAVGTVVHPGETLLEVDGEPVLLMGGERPLWRTLGPGVEDGPDVAQLEYDLVALGIVTTDELTVDGEWTSATTDAVEEWQESLGLEETGTVSPGDLVFHPGAVRVTDHPTPVGGSASGAVLEVSGITREVTVDLEATRQTLVERGQDVEIELPDGSTLAGTVSSVGTVATVPEDSGDDPNAEDAEPTIEVTIALDDPSQAGSLDEAPVTVRVVTDAARDVLAVPVDALLALAEGGYAVERVTGGEGADGTSGTSGTELVPVEIGAFADGWVQVTGDVAEGDDVVVPE
jgi:putative peptidoglycan binding protein